MARLLIGLLIVLSIVIVRVQATDPSLHVSRVIDGDTVVLSDGQHMRLAGLDCPESTRNAKCRRGSDCDAEVTRGQSVKRQVADIAIGSQVTVLPKTDKYGRAVGYVTLADGQDLGALLIATGACVDWSTRYPHPKAEQYSRVAAN